MHMKLKRNCNRRNSPCNRFDPENFLAMLNTPLTPNIIIAFYCLAIIVLKPKIFEALGIGIIAGFLSMVISGSVFPPANLISEAAGAYVCFIFYEILRQRQNLAPLVTTFVTTLASGFIFAGIATIFAGAHNSCHVPWQLQ